MESILQPGLSPSKRTGSLLPTEFQGSLWEGIRSSWRKPYTERVPLPFIHLRAYCLPASLNARQPMKGDEEGV